ncbi:MAG: Fic family protein, partial [Oscillospiraceae bacterium]
MKYISVKEASKLWGLSERSVRNYCALGRVEGAFLTGKTWNIPENAAKPTRAVTAKKAPVTLAEILADEMQSGRKGGIYHKIQVELTYNSNHIEGSRLTADQTRYIFETNTIGVLKDETVNVDDIIETTNHFRCIDLVISNYNKRLSEAFIKELHRVLKTGTSDSRKSWFAVGDYKKQPNEVGGETTVLPKDVHTEMKKLLSEYENGEPKTLEDIVEFHAKFEKIH